MVGSIEPDLKVARNDALTVDEIRNLNSLLYRRANRLPARASTVVSVAYKV